MLYRILLFVHVSAVIVWLGAGLLFQIFTERAAATGNASLVSTIIGEGERLGKTLFGPAAILVLASGVWMVFEGGWGFGQVFVIGGLIGVVASIVLGTAVIGATNKRLQEGFAASGTLGPETKQDLIRLRNVGRADVAIMTAVVFLMTVKPGL